MSEEKLPRLTDYRNIGKLHLHHLSYYSLIKDIEFAIATYAKGDVLDIGCGNKPYEKAFAGKITKYTGCDIVQSDKNKVDILCEATNIPLPTASIDTVFSSQTIEHIANYQDFINEAFRLLKPGGYFILSGPMYWHLHEEPNDYFRFTQYGFKYILENAGFEIEKILPNGGMWAVSGQSLLHSLGNSKAKFFPVRVCRFLYFKLRFQWLHNSFFRWLDKRDYNPMNTMNYVVIAHKK